jgi:hypothetical protein
MDNEFSIFLNILLLIMLSLKTYFEKKMEESCNNFLFLSRGTSFGKEPLPYSICWWIC